MDHYIFELIEHETQYPAKVFIASIDTSSFHWHYDYELMVVLKGSLVMKSVSEPYILNAGDVVLFNSKKVHSLRRTDQDNLCLFIQLPQQLFIDNSNKKQSYSFYLNSASKTMIPKVKFSVFLQTAVKIAIRSKSKEEVDVFRIKALIATLVADIIEYTQYDIRQYPDNIDTEHNSDVLLQINEFIELNIENTNITHELCKYIGMSEKTLYRFLKNSTGFTAKDLIDATRIEKSKVMLRQTNKSISFIEQECGFNSEVTFYRIFKKETGVTSNEYRENDLEVATNSEVQGYLNFDSNEANCLLKQYL